ncbi:MAG: YidC/Oxa1 family membrane protein insertase [Eubacteriales bacterium]|nr:YidC/Oxa1 family membrane protein insertase [Eubacteriales bacterium]
MNSILLSQYDGAFLGPIAKVLGWIMNAIFWVLDKIGIPNIGLAIILFTIVIYLLLMPLTIKQQKFSKLSAKMNPELQAINKKYNGRKDNDSMLAMQQETKAVYAKYGVSPTGSCVQMLIQMPILFALYRVFMNVPAYVTQVKEAFIPLVEKLVHTQGAAEFLSSSEHFKNAMMYAKQFSNEAFTSGNVEYVQNTFIDVLYKASTAEWNGLAAKFPSLAADVADTMEKMERYNNFLGLNMGNSPSYMVSEALANGAWLLVIAALIIPILSAVTQWLNVKLMPQADMNNNGQENSMASSMKMMNNIMPIMSAVFCYTMPTGMGLYWVAGAVVRSVQQVAINKHIDRMDIDAEIKKNIEKRDAKLRKKGIDPDKLNSYATMNTRNVKPSAPAVSAKPKAAAMTQAQKEEAVRKATDYYNKNAAKPGSLASKANMVKDYNERNNKR